MYKYKTNGTCSSSIAVEAADGIIKSVKFENGCSGNLQGISKLAAGMRIDDAIEKLAGIQCRNGTSCPDQLSRALTRMKAEGLG